MNKHDHELGMDRAITRRDFVNGVAVAAGAAVLPQVSLAAGADTSLGPQTAADYPPLRTGLRGDYQGVYTPAHALRDGGKAPQGQSTGETYDLVVVGGGLSGLGAAWYYREAAGPSARILILDNHDDFGGHAKRNEFVVGDRMLLAPGGSLRIPAFKAWSHESSRLVRHLGIARGDPRDQTDSALYQSLGMGPATFFNKAVYGRDLLVKGGTLQHPTKEFMDKVPLPKALKADIWRLWSNPKVDYLPGLTLDEKVAKLQSMSYRDYLLNVMKLSPDILPYVNGVWAISPDTSPAWFALFRGKPGFAGLGIDVPGITSPGSRELHEATESHYYIPGGNHSICRLILRELIPDCMPPGDFVQVETARFDYATLDRPQQSTRVRLNSTVVQARHVGRTPHSFELDGREVEITYLQPDGRAWTVKAKDVVMAGNNNMIPYICPEMDEAQKAALHKSSRAINVHTNVLLRNWKAFHKLGVSSISFPRSFFDSIALAQPRSFGALKESSDPSQPVLATFGIMDGLSNTTFFEEMAGGRLPPPGTPLRAQMAIARAGLYNTPYERFERAIRSQAAAALGAGGFDPARDILAITLNRWGHGYALPNDSLFDDPKAPPSYVTARRRFGRIAIANSDAGGIDTIEVAFNEAARAVRDLEPHLRTNYPAGIHWGMI